MNKVIFKEGKKRRKKFVREGDLILVANREIYFVARMHIDGENYFQLCSLQDGNAWDDPVSSKSSPQIELD